MTRRNALGLIALVGVVGLGSWWLTSRTERLAPAPLDNVPAGTTAAVWLDVHAVLGSVFWERLVEARGGDRGVRRIEALCGENPLDPLVELTVFATGDRPEALERVGVVGRGEFARDSLTACVRRVVEADGGHLEATEIDGVPAVAGRGSSRAAFIGDDGVVGGDESTVRGVLAAVRRDGGRMSDDAELAHLYGRVADGADVAAVGRLPVRWRESIRRLLRESVDADLAPLSSVHALAVGLRLRRGFGAAAVLAFDEEDAARAAADAVRAQIAAALGRPLVVLSAVGPALRRIDLDVRGRELTATVDISAERRDDLLELAGQLLDAREPPAPPPPRPPRPPAPSPEPDEVIHPTR